MKKMFTSLLILFICVSSIGTRINAQEQQNMQEDESYLTIEVIENSFWETLEKLEFPKITKEDEYLTWLIWGIHEPTATIPAFGGVPYINLRIGEFKEEYINFDRFIYKCQRVVELYNHTHDLQITMTSDISNSMLGIDVESQMPDFIENMVTITGQLAHVKKGTIYWESSKNFGSGKSGVIEETQPVIVTGVAYLNEDGSIISSYYGTDPKSIERWARRMIHLSVIMEDGKIMDLGWVYPTQLTCIE